MDDYRDGLIKDTEFFTTTELAKKLKMNVQVVTRKVQAGEIEAFKIGKDWRIPEQSVYAWLQRLSNKNGNGHNGNGHKTAAVLTAERPVTVAQGLPARGSSKRKHVLEYILTHFEVNRKYSEAEFNRLVSRFHNDYEALREEFLAEGMIARVDGGFQRRHDYRLFD